MVAFSASASRDGGPTPGTPAHIQLMTIPWLTRAIKRRVSGLHD
jgi:hypothetical protein